MQTFATLTIAGLLGFGALSACSRDKGPETVSPEQQTAALQNSPVKPPADAPAPVRYSCIHGAQLEAIYMGEIVYLQREGVWTKMEGMTAASGARYVGDSFQWWTKGSGKGSTASLSNVPPGETFGSMPIEECTEQ